MLQTLLDVQKKKKKIVRSGNETDRQKELISLQDKLLEIANEHKYKGFQIELDNLCQTQVKLVQLRIELESLQRQQAQIQIPPKGNN